ncbi:hypothetical protein C8Q75DRAFT_732761 [Abortiporus biennis]|nr:hypothetical protein C8Q75DRAFT_732761 [Abortiporus biennis]
MHEVQLVIPEAFHYLMVDNEQEHFWSKPSEFSSLLGYNSETKMYSLYPPYLLPINKADNLTLIFNSEYVIQSCFVLLRERSAPEKNALGQALSSNTVGFIVFVACLIQYSLSNDTEFTPVGN